MRLSFSVQFPDLHQLLTVIVIVTKFIIFVSIVLRHARPLIVISVA